MLAVLSGSILLFVISLKDEMLSDASDEGDNLPAAISPPVIVSQSSS